MQDEKRVLKVKLNVSKQFSQILIFVKFLCHYIEEIFHKYNREVTRTRFGSSRNDPRRLSLNIDPADFSCSTRVKGFTDLSKEDLIGEVEALIATNGIFMFSIFRSIFRNK